MGRFSGRRERRLGLVGAIAALTLLAVLVVAPASATNIKVYVAATPQPAQLVAGASGTVTLTLRNCRNTIAACGTTTSNAGIASATFTFPSGFAVTSVSSVLPSTWTATISGNQVKLKGTTSTRVLAGGSLSVDVGVTAPGTAGAYTIATRAYNSATFTGAFTRRGADPVLTVVRPPLATLEFDPQPGGQTAGVPFSVTVKGKDASGAPVSGDVVALALGSNPGGNDPLPPLSGELVGGSVTFPTVALTKAGVGYTLRATSGSVEGNSNAFDVAAAGLASLAFVPQPGNVQAGAAFGVTVEGEDAYGNPVSGPTVTLALEDNPAGGSLGGTLTGALAGGSVTIGGLSIQKAGVGYSLSAAATGASTIESASFDVTAGPLSVLTFLQQPTTTQAATTIAPAVTVKGTDAYGNLVPGDVTLAIGNNPAGGTLSGTVANVALDASGVATFADLSIDKPGLGYTLSATGGSGSATSSPFDIANTVCITNSVDCTATTDPGGQGATPANNTVGAVSVIDNGTGSGDGSIFVALDGAGSCPGLPGSQIGQTVKFVPEGFAGAFAKLTVTYDRTVTPNFSWTYKFCIDKEETAAVDYPNVPLCLVAALGQSDSPLLDAISWLFDYSAYQAAIDAYVSANGPCILRRGRTSGLDLQVVFYLEATDPRVTGFGA